MLHCQVPKDLPRQCSSPGLSAQRQWYLWDSIRDFCPEATKDVLCPRPTEARPSASVAVPQPVTSSPSHPSPGSRGRGRGRGRRGAGADTGGSGREGASQPSRGRRGRGRGRSRGQHRRTVESESGGSDAGDEVQRVRLEAAGTLRNGCSSRRSQR